MQSPRIHKWTVLHYSPFKEVWDWVILLLVLYTAVFTPYVAAFLLNEPGYNAQQHTETYGDDPIVIIDLLGMLYLISLAHTLNACLLIFTHVDLADILNKQHFLYLQLTSCSS